MMRYNLFLSNEQHRYLKKKGGNASEIIRRALDEYIEKQKNLNVSISSSERGDDKWKTQVPSPKN